MVELPPFRLTFNRPQEEGQSFINVSFDLFNSSMEKQKQGTLKHTKSKLFQQLVWWLINYTWKAEYTTSLFVYRFRVTLIVHYFDRYNKWMKTIVRVYIFQMNRVSSEVSARQSFCFKWQYNTPTTKEYTPSF